MRSGDDDQAPATRVEILPDGGDAGPGGADVIESGPGTRTPGWIRTPVVVVLLAMVVGGAAGYLVGHRRAGTPAAPPAGSASTTAPWTGSAPLAATGGRCAVQQGARLQLGLEIRNRSSTTAVVLHPAQVILPLHGLRVRRVTWGGCGQLAPAPGSADRTLPPGGTTWLAMTFDVLVACPAPLPVQVTIDYVEGGRAGIVDMLPFPDLGDVPYTNPGCPTGS